MKHTFAVCRGASRSSKPQKSSHLIPKQWPRSPRCFSATLATQQSRRGHLTASLHQLISRYQAKLTFTAKLLHISPRFGQGSQPTLASAGPWEGRKGDAHRWVPPALAMERFTVCDQGSKQELLLSFPPPSPSPFPNSRRNPYALKFLSLIHSCQA